jgi:peptidoglycan/LPS O-acetylase OafA/YrhL
VFFIMMAHLPVIVPKWVFGPLPGGFLSVDLFFVLSGFLISSLLCEEYFKTGGISFKKFYERRAFRLLPGLYVVLAAQILYAFLYRHSLGYTIGYDLERVGSVFLYLSNWVEVYSGNHPIPIGLGVMWTLAIEGQFYFLWPMVLLRLLRTKNNRVVFGGIVAIALIGMILRAVLFHHLEDHSGWAYLYLETESRFDDLMMGAGVAYLLQLGWRPGKYINSLGLIALMAFTAAAFVVHQQAPWLYYGGYTLSAFASILVILSVLDKGGLTYRIFGSRIVVWIGVRSYGLYLWHTFVFAAVQRHWPGASDFFLIPFAIAVSILAAALSYRIVERPFQQLRKRNRVISAHEGPAVTGATT